MPMSVDDLRRVFPQAVGDEFVLDTHDWPIPELAALVAAGTRLALRVLDFDRATLWIKGKLDTVADEVELDLTFLADAHGQLVEGLVARLDAAKAVAEAIDVCLGEAFEIPKAFLAELPSIRFRYDFQTGGMVAATETDHLRIALAAEPDGNGSTARVGLVGIKDTEAYLPKLPFIGDLIADGGEVGVAGVELLAVASGGVSDTVAATINSAIRQAVGDAKDWWPQLPARALEAGLWVGASCLLPARDPEVWVQKLTAPDVSWLALPELPSLNLGPFTPLKIGLSWHKGGSGGGSDKWGWGGWDFDFLRVEFDGELSLGKLTVSVPGIGFDFRLPDTGGFQLWPRFPAISFGLGGRTLRFDVPRAELPGLPPGLPGFPGTGFISGWFEGLPGVALPDLLGLLDIPLPDLPDKFKANLPSLGLSFDFSRGRISLNCDLGWLRFFLGGFWSGSGNWSTGVLFGLPDLSGLLGDLPFIGGLLGDWADVGIHGLQLFGVSLGGLSLPQVDGLNAWIRELVAKWGSWWPALPAGAALPAGFNGGIDWSWPGGSMRFGIPWPSGGGTPGTSWFSLPEVSFDPLTLPEIGLSLPELGKLKIVFKAEFDFGLPGGFQLEFPDLGFDFDFLAGLSLPTLPKLSFGKGGGGKPVFDVRPSIPNLPLVIPAFWQDAEGISASEIAAFFGLDLKNVPDALDPRLTMLGLICEVESRQMVLAMVTARTAWLLVSIDPPIIGRLTAVLAKGSINASASDLPLIGDAVIPEKNVTLTGVGFRYAPAVWDAGQAGIANTLMDLLSDVIDDVSTLPRFPEDGLPKGGAATVDYSVGGTPKPPLVIGLGSPGSGSLGSGGNLPVPLAEEASCDLGLAFGPVRLKRLALGFSRGDLVVSFDATFSVGPVEFALLGLGIGIDGSYGFKAVLQGASVLIDQPPLRVAGAFERREDGEFTGMIGLVAVETGFFALQAAGSYMKSREGEGWASVFLFGEAGGNDNLGLFGPPPFTVTGLSGGFGVNSTIDRVPAIEEIDQFPFMGRLGGGSGAAPSPGDMLDELTAWIRPHSDRYWAAVGVKFTSFKFIQGRALAVVEFGDALKLMLLGRTSVTFPKNADAGKKVHARIVIDLKLAYEQATSLLSLDVALGEGSFVFDESIRLTGGIAVYIWTGGQHGGDFAITAGGYHPEYDKHYLPDHYPRVARIGFVWSPDNCVRISAQGYTALTPNALMVGGRLAATYDKGLLSAWFTAYVDVLIQWKPFYLDMRMGISIGVAFTIKVWFVRVRVSITVGIDLELWTPPLGGNVKVKVWFVSFSFGFGSSRVGAPAVPWSEFRQQLPAPIAITPEKGLLADVDEAELAARTLAEEPTLVSGFGFTFTTESALPASAAKLNGEMRPRQSGDPYQRVDIRPMKKTGVTSEHVVAIRKGSSTAYFDWKGAGWKVTVIERDVARALWGEPRDKPGLGEPELIGSHVTGLRIEVPSPAEGSKVGIITAEALEAEKLPGGWVPLRPSAAAGPKSEIDCGSVAKIVATLAAEPVATRRTAVHTALAGLGVGPGADGSLAKAAAQAGKSLTKPPMTANVNAQA